MWIGAFAEAAGLSVATVRFYVRSGLLHPGTGAAGASRPYLDFSEKDLRRVAAIKAGQALGMSLAEIKSLIDERRAGRSAEKMLRAMTTHRANLARRAEELSALLRFVDAKIAWLRDGGASPMPHPPGFE